MVGVITMHIASLRRSWMICRIEINMRCMGTVHLGRYNLVKAESGSDTVLNGFQLIVFHMTDAVRESGFIDVCHLIAHSN